MTSIITISLLTVGLIIWLIVWTKKARTAKHKEQFARIFERIVKE